MLQMQWALTASLAQEPFQEQQQLLQALGAQHPTDVTPKSAAANTPSGRKLMTRPPATAATHPLPLNTHIHLHGDKSNGSVSISSSTSTQMHAHSDTAGQPSMHSRRSAGTPLSKDASPVALATALRLVFDQHALRTNRGAGTAAGKKTLHVCVVIVGLCTCRAFVNSKSFHTEFCTLTYLHILHASQVLQGYLNCWIAYASIFNTDERNTSFAFPRLTQ